MVSNEILSANSRRHTQKWESNIPQNPGNSELSAFNSVKRARPTSYTRYEFVVQKVNKQNTEYENSAEKNYNSTTLVASAF